MEVRLVTSPYLSAIVPMAMGFLGPLIDSGSGDYTREGVERELLSGAWKLLILTDGSQVHGACTFRVKHNRAGRTAYVQLLAGDKWTVTAATWTDFKGVLAAVGCKRIEMAAKGAPARLWQRFGFRPKYQVYEVEL